MSTQEFREHGHELVDWVADYLANVEQRPVRSGVEPGNVRGGLPALPPERPEPFSSLLADLDDVILPGITHWSILASSRTSRRTPRPRRSSATSRRRARRAGDVVAHLPAATEVES